MKYQPTPNLPDDLRGDFRRISDTLIQPEVDALFLAQRNVVPAKVTDGMVVYADGTNWNPGSGEGVYCYYNAGWNFLG